MNALCLVIPSISHSLENTWQNTVLFTLPPLGIPNKPYCLTLKERAQQTAPFLPSSSVLAPQLCLSALLHAHWGCNTAKVQGNRHCHWEREGEGLHALWAAFSNSQTFVCYPHLFGHMQPATKKITPSPPHSVHSMLNTAARKMPVEHIKTFQVSTWENSVHTQVSLILRE